jgi:hypothetical protein
MSNNFYNHGSFPTTGSAATSASMRAELDSIAAGFDKLPTLTGNANEIVVVNSSGTALDSIPTLPATSGGTGFASYAVGDLLFASTTTALSKLADVATGNALISGGVGVAPSYGKIGISTHVSGLGTGVATALGVNVGTAGAFVVNGGALGTPSSGTLTNATGLPVGTGISGLGTNVATALAVNVGTAGAFVVNGGALGTPSSGTVTNLTGTASININGTVGATTPTTGSFTNITGSANAVISVTDNTNAALRITQLGTGNALLVEDSANPDSSPFVINADGRVIQGYTASVVIGSETPNVQVASGSSSNNGFGNYSWTASSGASYFDFAKSRSSTIGANTVVQSGDSLGFIKFYGDDGAAFIESARIFAQVDGTPGTNDMPGRLIFATTADGGSSPTERMRIDNTGDVGIGTTTPTARLNVVDATSQDAVRITQTGSGNALVVEDSANPDSSPFVIDADGITVVGAATRVSGYLDYAGNNRTPSLQTQGTSIATGGIAATNWGTTTFPSGLFLAKSRGGVVATRGVVSNNDNLGVVLFSGDDATNFIPGAAIFGQVDGTPGTNDMPGRLVFSTTADGASSPTERMRISSAGLVTITGALTASADSSFTSTGALLISKGTTGEQPGSPATGMMRYNSTTNQFEGYSGSSPAWKSIGGSALSNDTSTASNLYPVFAGATTGTAENLYTSNAKLLYKPSTGELSASVPRADNGIFVNKATIATSYTIASGDNGMSAGTITVADGVTVTVSDGSFWTVV